MATKRNANIVSLTKSEKASTVRALLNQVGLLEAEKSPNDLINKVTAQEVLTIQRVIEKLS